MLSRFLCMSEPGVQSLELYVTAEWTREDKVCR
jgi:hypothetical protein